MAPQPDEEVLNACTIKELWIYPIKSCQGIKVQSAEITDAGFKHDRRWCVASRDKTRPNASEDDPWHIENQFEMHPELAKIAPEIKQVGGSLQMILRAPRVCDDEVSIPIREHMDTSRPVLNLQALGANTGYKKAEDEGDEVAAWLTKVLAKGSHAKGEYRLGWLSPDDLVHCDANSTYGHLFQPFERIAFHAKAQLLVVTAESLDNLNESIVKMGDVAVPMYRFRPNVILHGTTAWDEENWAEVSINAGNQEKFTLRTAMSAVRCTETTVFQREEGGGFVGTRDPSMQPFKAMKKYHVGPGGMPRFGVTMNTIYNPGDEPSGWAMKVNAGDEVKVLQRLEDSLINADMSKSGANKTKRNSCSKWYDHQKEVDQAHHKDLAHQSSEYQIAQAAHAGDGTVNNVGIKMDGTMQCPHCRQKFMSPKALDLHYKFIHDPNRHMED